MFEYKCAAKIQNNKLLKGKASPIIGAVVGCVPQCGFSVISTDLFSKKVISVGALIAVYIATSDEAIPIMFAKPSSIPWMLLLIAVKIVDSLDDAMEHIKKYSTGHSECIITESYTNAQRFVNELDAAALYVNASTRFTDGGQFGLGAEIGISTGKLHARGPMGIKDLTTVKFVVRGDGQIR